MLADSSLEIADATRGEVPGAVPLVKPMYKGVARAR
jgi:hypothetical protein